MNILITEFLYNGQPIGRWEPPPPSTPTEPPGPPTHTGGTDGPPRPTSALGRAVLRWGSARVAK